jgi:hypothetical protein
LDEVVQRIFGQIGRVPVGAVNKIRQLRAAWQLVFPSLSDDHIDIIVDVVAVYSADAKQTNQSRSQPLLTFNGLATDHSERSTHSLGQFGADDPEDRDEDSEDEHHQVALPDRDDSKGDKQRNIDGTQNEGHVFSFGSRKRHGWWSWAWSGHPDRQPFSSPWLERKRVVA